MSGLPSELRDLVESGPLAHLSTINADGSPQVSVIWVGLDGDDLVSGHMQWYAKLRNIERDPRVVLSFEAPRAPGVFLNPYAVLHARATIEPGEHVADAILPHRPVPFVVEQPGLDAGDVRGQPLAVAEWHRLVLTAVQQQHRNRYLGQVEPPRDELRPAVVPAALD